MGSESHPEWKGLPADGGSNLPRNPSLVSISMENGIAEAGQVE